MLIDRDGDGHRNQRHFDAHAGGYDRQFDTAERWRAVHRPDAYGALAEARRVLRARRRLVHVEHGPARSAHARP
ncbi:hypothetical protein [Actinomycetospora sp. NBC_00405]|uniref:hypothetical protein n=1 Tax=Actinomycetospora sp. NBC_00405 TaxID=2975952 RepID=UPI002E1F7AAE